MTIFQKNLLIDRGILLLFGFFLLLTQPYNSEKIIFVLLPITLNLLILLINRPKLAIVELIILLLLANWWPEYLYFISLCFYDASFDKDFSTFTINSAILGIFLISSSIDSMQIYCYVIFICLVGTYLGIKYNKQKKLINDYEKITQKHFESTFLLKNESIALLKEQDTKIALELSNERNRIARDIHDNVGHLLSSALLQIGAVQTVNQQENLIPLLEQLKHTLHDAMDNIRESVHDLHEESLNLSLSLDKLLNSFTFCEIKLKGEIPETISKEYKLTYITLIKEALANVMKHSNATCVTIQFQTHPGFYKLAITDNGSFYQEKSPLDIGIGLAGMKERIEIFSGKLNYQHTEKGFVLLIILPKLKGE